MDKTEERLIITINIMPIIWGEKLDNDYYNVSSVRLMRYLYALGFDKESYINNKGKENWRFKKSDGLTKSLDFYYFMRKENNK